MTRLKWLLCAFLLTVSLSREAKANTIVAKTCNSGDMQSAINSAATGDTVTIPSGTCTWTSGVTISGKGITVQGAGSGRIVARTSNTLTLATGALTITGLTFSPGFSASTLTSGLTLRVFQEGGCISPPASGTGPCQYNVPGTQNWMQGTVTGYTGGTLTMDITSDQVCPAGTCGPSGGVDGKGGTSTHRWLIATIPQTTIVLNTGTATGIQITENTSGNIRLGGFKLLQGTTTGYWIRVVKASGGLPVVGQNLWLEGNGTGGDWINLDTNQGVWANNSFDSAPFSFDPNAFQIQPYDETAWATPSFWGALDTTGTHAVYIETSDFHAFLGTSDNDEGGRVVLRYNVYDSAGIGSHGADTGPIGMRTLEWYNNTGVFDPYGDGTTFPMNQWFYARGGSFVIYNNTLPALTSTDFGTKSDVNMTVMNLQRNAGPNPCWGQGTSGGADHYAPRQIGIGHVTGTGTDGKGQSTYSAASYGFSATEYVGDPEPAYIWGNSRVPLGNTGTSDYGLTQTNSCSSGDTTANYIVLNRDYFNGSTAKPGYSPYTYPHPLTLGQSSAGNPPASPSNLSATVE